MDQDANSLVAILDRAEARSASAEDWAKLRRVLLVAGDGNVVQPGKYNMHLGVGKNIEIADRVFTVPSAAAIKDALRSATR